MTSKAEGVLDRSGEGVGGGEGSTNFGRLGLTGGEACHTGMGWV